MSNPTGRLTNRWQLGIVAIIAVAAIALLMGTAAVAAPTTAAEAVALQYMDARDRTDAESALALFADDAIVVDSPLVTLDHHTEVFELFEALQWKWAVDECVETASGTPAEVTCTYSTENAWSQALGVAPIGGQIRFAIEGSLISEMYHDFDRARWYPDVEREFQRWLTINHPADVAIMWQSEGFTRADDADNGLTERLIPRLTAKSLELYERYAADFAAVTG